MKKQFLFLAMLALVCASAWGSVPVKYNVISSPDGKVKMTVTVSTDIKYSVTMDDKTVLDNSPLYMQLSNGTVWGNAYQGKLNVKKWEKKEVRETIASPFTRQAKMKDEYNQLILRLKEYNVEFRVYDNGVAYRFVSNVKGEYQVQNECVEYNFTSNLNVTTPYILNYEAGKTTFQQQFNNSFENVYTTLPLSQLDKQRLSFLPLVVDLGEGRKMCITESHLESYPGLYLKAGQGNQLVGMQAPYPKTMHQGGHNNLQMLVDDVEDYIAKCDGPRSFPWRIAMLSRNDTELAVNNLSYILGDPSRLKDTSWIKPGKVAWDWWNDWNLKGVDFEAGINTETYKYYIDFAAQNGIEYVILDEGWAVNGEADLMKVIPEIDLKAIIAHGKKKGVDIILWAGYLAFDRDMENICKHYADMGVKGFKIDFMDRDDQIVTDFYYRTAAMTAKYHMLADFHGAFKPSGLNRTYPNVINFEGVSGLEQMKWEPTTRDQLTYDCQLPFIRQTAGPMDYTQGAMRNAGDKYVPNYSSPMSQGTRCHQLGLYIVLESPLNMLCYSPSNYMSEPECTKCIAQVPTVWDETHVLCGEMGKYIVTARRKGNTWYVGGITSKEAREVEFTLPEGIKAKKAELFRDGINATKNAEDYKHETINVQKTMKITMAPGGGFIMKM